ncbi:MAG: hypothetical protein ACK48V_06555 [Crocinitomicaceae bacterium]
MMLLFVIPILLGCKKITTDNLVLNVDTDVFNAPTMLVFENAKAGATKQPLEFSVTISGPDKDKVVSGLGTQKFEVHDGWIALNLIKGVEPSISNPIRFVINAKINGFEDVRKEVTLVSKDELSVDIKVIEKGNLPSGIAEESKSYKLNAGAFSTNEIFSTKPENGTEETASLTFRAGTKFRDKDNNLISGDSVRTKVRYYNVSDESVQVFTGGLSPQNLIDKNGKEIVGGVNFFTAGLMDIDMSVGGKEVKSFDIPLQAEMKLNPMQDNFMTGQKIKVGDSIPVWSLDETTGQWKEEKSAIVVESLSGGLAAKFEINHLSSWNLDWGWSAFGSYGDAGGALDVKFTAPWSNATGNYEVTLRSPNGGYLGALHCASIFNGFIAHFRRTPRIPLAYIEIFDNLTGNLVVKSDLFNPGTKGSLEIKMPQNTIEYIDIALTYELVCTKNPKLKPNTSTWICVTDLQSNKSQRYYTGISSNKTTKGSLEIRLVNGKNYKVSTVGIDGKLISCEVVFDVKNLQYQNIKGLEVKKLEYNPTTKKVIVDCKYTTDKC